MKLTAPALALALVVVLGALPAQIAQADDYNPKAPKVNFVKTSGAPDPANPSLADRADAVNQKQFDYMKTKYGGVGNIPPEQMTELKNRKDWLAPGACDGTISFNVATNPDCNSETWTCTGAMYDRLVYGGGATSGRANAGIIKYMRASLMGDAALYGSAFRFYEKMKTEVDLGGGAPPPGDGAGAGIGRPASKNLFQMAKDAVKEITKKDDAYLAMKVLIVYGHDNMNNNLSAGDAKKACQSVLLDTIKPEVNSNLYLNNAIGEAYYEDDVTKATEIDKE